MDSATPPSARGIAFARLFEQAPPEWQSWIERLLEAMKAGRIRLTDSDAQVVARLPVVGIKTADRWLRRKLIRPAALPRD